jgi:hypothetical protein
MILLLAVLRLWAPYQEFCEKLKVAELAKGPAAAHDRLRLILQAGDGQQVLAVIKAKTGDIELQLSKGAELPLTRALWDENPDVMTDLPQGTKVSIGLDFGAVLPQQLSLSAQEFFAPLEQANRYIKGQAGVFSFAAPKLTGIEVRFAHPIAMGAVQTDRITLRPGKPRVDLPERPIDARLVE